MTQREALTGTQPSRWVVQWCLHLALSHRVSQHGMCAAAAAGCSHIDSCPPNPHLPTPQGGFGSRVPISLEQCALACQGAPGCDMFTFNAVQQGCFLKTGQCPLRNNCQVGKRGRGVATLLHAGACC